MRTKRRGNKRNGVNLIRWKSGWRELVCCDSCRFCSLFIFLPTYFPPLASIKIPLYMCLTIRVYAVRICIKPKTINSLYHILVKILSKTYAHTHTVVVLSPFPVFILPPRFPNSQNCRITFQ